MYLAEDDSGNRIISNPNTKGKCPICHAEVIPKCGEIKAWHWAHKSIQDCDTWSEPESEWHYGWKRLAGLDNTEIVIKKNDSIHRADIKIDNRVIELQHSNLASDEVREREEFYGNMIWVIDGDELIKEVVVDRMISKEDKFYFTYSLKKRAWMKEIQKRVFYHFKKLIVYTYYYQKYYKILNFSCRDYGQAWKTMGPDHPIAAWRRAAVEGYPIVYEDVLISPHNEKNYCSLMSKEQFKNNWLTARSVPKVII